MVQYSLVLYHPQLTTLSKEGDLNDDSAYPTSKGGDKKQASKDESDEEEVSAVVQYRQV